MKNIIDHNVISQVLELINWKKADHNQYMYECAEGYLSRLMPDYPQVQTQIMKSATFWKWWQQHWEKRDMQFIETVDEETPGMIDPVELYKEIHDPRALLAGVYLNGQVLQESYASLIELITKEQEVAA